MAIDYANNPSSIFSPCTRAAFLQYLHENPNNRRISQTERLNLIGWLTNPNTPSSSQTESSRRNYVRKAFAWDEYSQTLLAVAKKNEDRDREVVTEDMIVDVVERVHTEHGHPGWDTTWREVHNTYYGILRADVIFLLKQCGVCAQNPRKRPKGSTHSMAQSQVVSPTVPDLMAMNDMFYVQYSTSGALPGEACQGGQY